MNFEILLEPKLRELLTEIESLLFKEKGLRFNVFSVSNFRSHVENFHNDIIAELLNPKGAHGEGRLFLDQFLDYLNERYHEESSQLKAAAFTTVLTEKDRIDILIKGENKAIIIESKVNDAVDQPDQVDRYYNKIDKAELEITDVIYLTLRGIKSPPKNIKQEAQKVLREIALLRNDEDDLVNKWLKPCYEKCKTEDSRSFIHQYIKLIKFLAFMNEKVALGNEFYSFLEKQKLDDQKFILELPKLLENLTYSRKHQLRKAIGENHKPFSKAVEKYKENIMLYEGFSGSNENCNFQLGIVFSESGKVKVYIHDLNNKKENKTTEELLKIASIIEKFEAKEWGFQKTFNVEKTSLKDLDEEVLTFVKEIFKSLK